MPECWLADDCICPVCNTNADKLKILADWLDKIDWSNNKEIQNDLREWAKNIEGYINTCQKK